MQAWRHVLARTWLHARCDQQLCTPGPLSAAAPRACDACLHPSPAMDACTPRPRSTKPAPAMVGCSPGLRWTAATRARDLQLNPGPRSTAALRACDGWLQPAPAIDASSACRGHAVHGLNSRQHTFLRTMIMRATTAVRACCARTEASGQYGGLNAVLRLGMQPRVLQQRQRRHAAQALGAGFAWTEQQGHAAAFTTACPGAVVQNTARRTVPRPLSLHSMHERPSQRA